MWKCPEIIGGLRFEDVKIEMRFVQSYEDSLCPDLGENCEKITALAISKVLNF